MNWKRLFFGEPERRNFQQPQDPSVSDGTILSWAGLGELGALNISTFFRGVQLISTSISQLPIYTKKVNGKGDSNILKNHITNLLWTDPANLVDKTTMIRNIVQSVICKGNAYVYIVRGDEGTPVSLRYLPSSDVIVTYQKERNELYYTCSYINNGRKIKPSDMLHFKMFTWDGVRGVSVITYATQAIDTTNATSEQAKEFFQKGCSGLSGILTVNSQLNDKQRQQILNTWYSTYSSSKAGIAVLQGNMQWQGLNSNPDDAQMLESREFNQADIAQWLNINPAQLGLKGYTNYTSFEDANNELLQRTLMPYIVMIENELTRKLVPNEKNVKIILDTISFMRPNKQAQSSYYTQLVNSGILSINEVRKELGYGDIDGGDEHHIPYSDVSQNSIENNANKNNDNGEGTEEIQ